jgi:hypothetical protein
VRTQIVTSNDDEHGWVSPPKDNTHIPVLPTPDENHLHPSLLEDNEEVKALQSWAGALF